VVEEGAVICAYAVIDAGLQLGPHSYVGDGISLRPGVRLRVDASIGGGSAVGRDTDFGEEAVVGAQRARAPISNLRGS